MEDLIDSFIRFLAVERGLSENYQLSTQRSLSEFAQWFPAQKKNHSAPRCDSAGAERISCRTQTRRSFGIFDQADRSGAKDFFSISRRQSNHHSRSVRGAGVAEN